ncbi:hypothetical protein BKA62DRAFT_829115 [Auriculariales sp. MPI-PUGE-AT-0066]|nr:hypothetical protein BKA62DRAFT_829115 [Auriculariales sp. MPI-PUGE-AT-0066]
MERTEEFVEPRWSTMTLRHLADITCNQESTTHNTLLLSSMGPDNMSALAPVQPNQALQAEKAKSSSWFARQAAQSLAGRVVVSAYESLKATKNVVCLSPWGDSSPLVGPSIRFRDIFIESIMASTGGTASFVAPQVGNAGTIGADALADSITATLISTAGDELASAAIEESFPKNDVAGIAENAGVKTVNITLRYKHNMTDASLGFYRSSLHRCVSILSLRVTETMPNSNSSPDSLFSTTKDLLAIQKGWFNPYLFASCRRPVIPRGVMPDVVFCHFPFEAGDYDIGQMLLAESSVVVCFSSDWTSTAQKAARELNEGDAGGTKGLLRKLRGKEKALDDSGPISDGDTTDDTAGTVSEGETNSTSSSKKEQKAALRAFKKHEKDEKTAAEKAAKDERRPLGNAEQRKKTRRKRSQSPTTPDEHLGDKSEARRESSAVSNYQWASAIVLPARVGVPLLAWDAVTVSELWKLDGDQAKLSQHSERLYEFADMCVDFGRVDTEKVKGMEEHARKEVLKEDLRLLVEGAAKSGSNTEVRGEIDGERAGIVFWRVP